MVHVYRCSSDYTEFCTHTHQDEPSLLISSLADDDDYDDDDDHCFISALSVFGLAHAPFMSAPSLVMWRSANKRALFLETTCEHFNILKKSQW
jgi:hypothetical protein